LQQREVEQRTRVPILGDLPIFGRLFSSTRRSQEETEVLVFITPHILRDGEAATQTAMLTTPELLSAYWSNLGDLCAPLTDGGSCTSGGRRRQPFMGWSRQPDGLCQ